MFSIIVACVGAQVIHLNPSLSEAIENAALRVIVREINRESYERGNNLVISDDYRGRSSKPVDGTC